MAKETFSIIFASGIPDLQNLTFDQVTDYKDNNWNDFAAKKFRVEKTSKPEIVKKDDEEKYNESLKEYWNKLTAAQISDIKEGKKKIAHNEKDGFYLRSLKSQAEEYNISLSQIEEKRNTELKSNLKRILMEIAPGQMLSEYDPEEVRIAIDKIFKSGKL